MSSIRKVVLSGGKEHYIQIDSSLDLEEIEVTGSDPVSGKTVHVSLSSLLKQPSKPISESSEENKPLDMFSAESEVMSEEERPSTLETSANEESDNSDVINDLFD